MIEILNNYCPKLQCFMEQYDLICKLVGIDELSTQPPINSANRKIYINKNKKHNV